MKRKSLNFLSIAAAGVLMLTPMPARATVLGQTATVDDRTVTDRVDARLSGDSVLNKYDIDVTANAGVVTLTGKVRTEAEKARAAREAKVAGVTRVDNRITVDKDATISTAHAADKTKSAVGTAADKTKEGLGTAADKTKDAASTAVDKTKDATATAVDKTKKGASVAVDKTKDAASTGAQKTEKGVGVAVDKTKDATETAGEKTKDALSKTGEVISDGWITTKVHTAFVGEDLLKGSDISVDTNNHVVTLKGTVKSDAARARAVQIAKTTEGVTRVVDTLKISGE